MNSKLYCKILAVLIIVLFIGAGIHSAFAVVSSHSIRVNQNEECSDCIKLNNSEYIKIYRLLNKVEVYSKLLLVLSKDNPEIKDEIEELSDKISILKEEFAIGQPFPTICAILETLYDTLEVLYWIFEEWFTSLEPFQIGFFFSWICYGLIRHSIFPIFFVGYLFYCWEWPGPPTGTFIVKIMDTRGGSPKSGVYVGLRNENYSKLAVTQANGKVYFFFTSYKDWDVEVDWTYVETVEFYQPKLEICYYLDEL